MGQNQAKGGGDAEAPESISLLDGGGGEPSSDPNTHFTFPLHLAARSGNLEKVEELLLIGSSNNDNDSWLVSDSLLRGVDEVGRTPLHCATLPESSHNYDVVQLLLQRDKEVNSFEGKPLLANIQQASSKGKAVLTDLKDVSSSEGKALLKNLKDVSSDGKALLKNLRTASSSEGKSVKAVLQDASSEGKALLTNLKDASSEGGKALLTNLKDAAFAKRPLLANLVDASKRTALHYAAASRKPRVVSLLLDHGADPNLKDADGSTPLHILAESNSDFALECAQLLLDSPSLNPSAAGSETNSKGHTVLQQSAVHSSPKLLKLFMKRGFDYWTPGGGAAGGYTPLMMTSAAIAEEDGGDSKENLECVTILLEEYSNEQVNAQENKHGSTALHLATQHERLEILKLLNSSFKADLFIKDFHGRTAFHYAILQGSLPSVKALCDCMPTSKDKFVDIIFHSHKWTKEEITDSPIGIAIQRNHTQIVDYLLAAHPREDDWMSDDVLMSFIYSKHPTALVSRMDDSLRRSAIWGLKTAKIYFRIITGAKDPVKERALEAKYLYEIKKAPKEEQKRTLLHPLIRIFLEKKWRRIRMLTWIHIIIQLLWVLSYSVMVYEMYAPNCHNNTQDGGNNKTETTEEKGISSVGKGEEEEEGNGYMRIITSLGFLQLEESCKFNQMAVQWTVLILYFLSALVLAKESFQIIMKPHEYCRDWINYIQLGILVVGVVNSIPAWQLSSASDTAPWQINLAAIGVFAAWVMLLSELDNFPKCALYSAILKTVLWNCLKTMLFYLPLLIGFAMCLRLLIPGKGQHNYLLFSLIKVVVMMTGEQDFEDAFYGDDTTSGPSSSAFASVLAQIMFLLLVLVTTIALLNLLTGLAVQDVGQLLREAEEQRLLVQLDRMYMLESFTLGARNRLKWFDSWENLLYRMNVTGVRGPGNQYSYSECIVLVIENYSEEVQARILEVIGKRKEK